MLCTTRLVRRWKMQRVVVKGMVWEDVEYSGARSSSPNLTVVNSYFGWCAPARRNSRCLCASCSTPVHSLLYRPCRRLWYVS
jgi:hypothetical protein